jgi:hypothetical protein
MKEAAMKTLAWMSVGTAAVLLAACGGAGGGETAPPATESVPDSASSSPAGMTSWLAQVASTAPEDMEALDIAKFAPPQPDDTEPEALR